MALSDSLKDLIASDKASITPFIASELLMSIQRPLICSLRALILPAKELA